MPQPVQPKSTDKRLSCKDFENKPVNRPREFATENYTPRELERLKRLCVNEHHRGEAAEQTRVEIRSKDNRTKRLVPVTEKDAVNRAGQTSLIKPLGDRNTADVTNVDALTQADFRSRMTDDRVLGNHNTTQLHQSQRWTVGGIANRFFPFKRFSYFCLKYRVTILIAVCSIAALALLLDVPILDNSRISPSSVTSPKTPKRTKQQVPKSRSAIGVKPKVDLHSAPTTARLPEEASTPTASAKRHSSAVSSSSTPDERVGVDLLIAGRLRAALKHYCELALHRPDRPVYRLIAHTLSRQIAGTRSQPAPPGNDLCEIPESE